LLNACGTFFAEARGMVFYHAGLFFYFKQPGQAFQAIPMAFQRLRG